MRLRVLAGHLLFDPVLNELLDRELPTPEQLAEQMQQMGTRDGHADA